MRAVWRAILLDPEARDAAKLNDAQFGKLREPVLRLSAWIRAFDVKSTSGITTCSLSPMPATDRSGGVSRAFVFNFYRRICAPQARRRLRQGWSCPRCKSPASSARRATSNFVESMAVTAALASSST